MSGPAKWCAGPGATLNESHQQGGDRDAHGCSSQSCLRGCERVHGAYAPRRAIHRPSGACGLCAPFLVKLWWLNRGVTANRVTQLTALPCHRFQSLNVIFLYGLLPHQFMSLQRKIHEQPSCPGIIGKTAQLLKALVIQIKGSSRLSLGRQRLA